MCSENTSGHGEFAIIPEEIKNWNWGAFWFFKRRVLGCCKYETLSAIQQHDVDYYAHFKKHRKDKRDF